MNFWSPMAGPNAPLPQVLEGIKQYGQLQVETWNVAGRAPTDSHAEHRGNLLLEPLQQIFGPEVRGVPQAGPAKLNPSWLAGGSQVLFQPTYQRIEIGSMHGISAPEKLIGSRHVHVGPGFGRQDL